MISSFLISSFLFHFIFYEQFIIFPSSKYYVPGSWKLKSMFLITTSRTWIFLLHCLLIRFQLITWTWLLPVLIPIMSRALLSAMKNKTGKQKRLTCTVWSSSCTSNTFGSLCFILQHAWITVPRSNWSCKLCKQTVTSWRTFCCIACCWNMFYNDSLTILSPKLASSQFVI